MFQSVAYSGERNRASKRFECFVFPSFETLRFTAMKLTDDSLHSYGLHGNLWERFAFNSYHARGRKYVSSLDALFYSINENSKVSQLRCCLIELNSRNPFQPRFGLSKFFNAKE